MEEMGNLRKILVYGQHFWEFYNRQTHKVKTRINWTIRLIETTPIVPENYLKHISGTELYEIRVSSAGNIFRIFCFFDRDKLVVLLNAFQKKTQKTPENEIERAERLKNNYYEDKQK
jgi:phage-related protein